MNHTNRNPELEYLKRRGMQQHLTFHDTSSKEPHPFRSYWTFLKLRIGFSFLLFLFLLSFVKAVDSPEAGQLRDVLKQMNQKDPYTEKTLQKINLWIQKSSG